MVLAELTGLSEDQISKVERGKSWVGELTLGLLAKALDVPQSSLFDYSENEAFLRNGGLRARAPRKQATLIVRKGKHVLVSVPNKVN
jgi:transcriptional regulator with XRE-family HTH domain